MLQESKLPSFPRFRPLLYLVSSYLLLLCLDAPFWLYWMTGNVCIAATYRTNLVVDDISSALLPLLLLALNSVSYYYARPYELTNIHHFEPVVSWDALNASDVQFFQMYNPVLPYMDEIEDLMQKMNQRNASQLVRVPIDPAMDVWSSDLFRYLFFLSYWKYLDAHGKHIPTTVCLVESDFVFNMTYMSSVLHPSHLDFVYVQHLWSHESFEPYNLGLACASGNATRWTKLWMSMMASLHTKRYRRLLPEAFLAALLPNHMVLELQTHHGCSSYHSDCKYIHFARPKEEGIEEAERYIESRSIQRKPFMKGQFLGPSDS